MTVAGTSANTDGGACDAENAALECVNTVALRSDAGCAIHGGSRGPDSLDRQSANYVRMAVARIAAESAEQEFVNTDASKKDAASVRMLKCR